MPEVLFIQDWIVKPDDGDEQLLRTWFMPDDFDSKYVHSTGIDFMKVVVNYFSQDRLAARGGPVFGDSYQISSGKKMYLVFKWKETSW